MLRNEIYDWMIDAVITTNNRYCHNNQQKKSQKNRDAVIKALLVANDKADLTTYLWENRSTRADIVQQCNNFCYSKSHAEEETPEPTPTEEVTTVETKPVKTDNNFAQGLDVLSNIIVQTLAQMKMDDLSSAVMSNMKSEIDKYIVDTYGKIERKVEIEVNGAKHEIPGLLHEKFQTVLGFVAMNEPVFLTGAAGTGKNYLCKQIAQALGLDFYFTNAVTQEYKLTGFTDANGNYQESQFYKAFTKGGLFMLDEMDASIPEVLIILNAAIANRYFDFPAPIGKVEAHPNFRVVAAGNTYGNGADYDYVGRNQLDAASMDRFAMVRIDYDQRIEEGLAGGDTDLLNFCRKFRKSAKSNGIRVVVSYRAIERMAKLSKTLEPQELLSTCLTKGLEPQDLRNINYDCDGCGKYSEALKALAYA